MIDSIHNEYVNEGLYGSALSTSSMGQFGIEHLKKIARERSWIMKAEVYDDLIGNKEELKSYNSILGDPDNYKVIDEKSQFNKEDIDKGMSKTKLSVFIKYLKFDKDRYEKLLKELKEEYSLDTKEEEELPNDKKEELEKFSAKSAIHSLEDLRPTKEEVEDNLEEKDIEL